VFVQATVTKALFGGGGGGGGGLGGGGGGWRVTWQVEL